MSSQPPPEYPSLGPARLPDMHVDRTHSARRWSSRTRLWMYASSALATALCFWVLSNRDTYYMIGRLVPSPAWFLLIAILLSASALWDQRRGHAAWGTPALTVALVVCTAIAFLSVRAADSDQVSSTTSPDGRFTVVVTEGAAMIDPLWNVTVRQNAGLTSRQWYAGCLNGDDPQYAYTDTVWTEPSTFEVVSDGGRRVRVRVDPSGRPLDRVFTPDAAVC